MTVPVENAKYQAIMQSAKELFWKYGIKKVSVEDICLKAAVSKMTFYRFFNNKVELAKAIFDVIVSDSKRKFREVLQDDCGIPEKITRMINMKLEGINDISKEFLMDLYKNPELGLREHVEKASEDSWNEIILYFRLAQRKGIFRKDIKPGFLLYFSKKMGEMVTDETLISRYGSPAELIRELTNFFVYGVAERKVKL